jgi:hypothetical protein
MIMKLKVKSIGLTITLALITTLFVALYSAQTTFAAAPQGTLTGSTISLVIGIPTAINPITVTDFSTAEITAVNDIRIKIPTGVNAIWDTSDNNVDTAGTASAKVASTVTFADSDKTLILDVDPGDFANDDTLIISNLSFIGQGGSAAGALTWSIDGGATYLAGNSNTSITVTGGNRHSVVTPLPALDVTPPTNISAAIVGAPNVPTMNIALTLAATGATEMRISNNADFEGSNWENYDTSKTWTLTKGDGLKTVYVQFRDAAGNVSPTIQSVVTVGTSVTTTTPPSTPTTPSLLPPSPSSNTNPAASFSDITGHWANSFITELFKMGIVKGKTAEIFAPEELLTRAEIVKIAILTFKIELKIDAKSSFKDVNVSDWFSAYVAAAESKGIISGYKDGSFKPNDPVNRAEALKILLIASGKDIGEIKTGPFVDILPTAWFAKYVNYAFNKGIVAGKTSTTFSPGDNITRGEIAKISVLASKL